MAAAAILALAELRDGQRRPEAWPRLHDRCDTWLTQLEAGREDRTPTLAELTQAVTEGLVEHAHRATPEECTAGCPQGGETWSTRGLQERRVETLGGVVRLRRPSCYGLHCHWGTTPVDEAQPLMACRKPPDVQKAAVQWTQEGPDETAGARFEPLTGMPLRARTAHDVTPAVAAGLTVWDVAPSREEVLAKIAAVAAGQPWRPILVLALDEAEVPTRPETAKGRRPGRKRARWTGAWREATGLRCYLPADDRIVQVLSWHPVPTDAEAAEALRQVTAAGLIPEAAVRLCVMADGAPWIWQQAPALFPAAVAMLDASHCRERLHKVAALPYGVPPERQRAWCEAALARLFDGAGHGVIWGLQRMKPPEAPAAQESATLIADLPRHQERLDARFARQGGYPRGSGGLESANKFSGHVRLKRSGAWGDVTNANQLLALRCATYQGTFGRVLTRYRQRRQDRSG